MTLDWTILGELKSPCSKDNLSACSDVNIYFDKYKFQLRIQLIETQTSPFILVTSSTTELSVKQTTCFQAISRNARFLGIMLQLWQWVMSMPTRLHSEHS